MKGQNSTKYFGLFEGFPVTNWKPTASWRLAEGYLQTLSGNVLRTFRILSIITFWERYLLTLSGLSTHVLLTLFYWVGTFSVTTPEKQLCYRLPKSTIPGTAETELLTEGVCAPSVCWVKNTVTSNFDTFGMLLVDLARPSEWVGD